MRGCGIQWARTRYKANSSGCDAHQASQSRRQALCFSPHLLFAPAKLETQSRLILRPKQAPPGEAWIAKADRARILALQSLLEIRRHRWHRRRFASPTLHRWKRFRSAVATLPCRISRKRCSWHWRWAGSIRGMTPMVVHSKHPVIRRGSPIHHHPAPPQRNATKQRPPDPMLTARRGDGGGKHRYELV